MMYCVLIDGKRKSNIYEEVSDAPNLLPKQWEMKLKCNEQVV